MKKVHKVMLYFLAFMVVVIGALAYYASQPRIVMYVGDGCPHCKNVEDWLTAHNMMSQVTLKEVWYNKNNAAELGAAAVKCGLDPTSVGIPMLPVKGDCIIGDGPIIAYFNSTVKQ